MLSSKSISKTLKNASVSSSTRLEEFRKIVRNQAILWNAGIKAIEQKQNQQKTIEQKKSQVPLFLMGVNPSTGSTPAPAENREKDKKQKL